MSTDAWLGIDLGTSGCRAIAIDASGDILAQHHLSFPTSNRSEQTPQQQWQYIKQLLSRLIPELEQFTLKAICVDATSGSVLLTDNLGKPISPMLMYNDSRASEQAKQIKRQAPAQSGAHGASSGLAKLMWLQQHLNLPTHHHLLHQADWILYKLGAPLGVSDYNNALKTGFDPVGMRWPAWLPSLIDTQCLPEIVAPGTEIGTMNAELATELGLTYLPKLIAGTTDSIAAFLATGAQELGEAVTSLGSTLVLKLISDRQLFVPEQGIYSHRLGDKWLLGGASNSGGAVLRQYFSDKQLDTLSRQIDLNTTPPDYYPLPAPGERFPINDPLLPPRLTPRPANDAEFLYGLLAGIARIEARGYELLRMSGAPPLRSLRTVGGGAKNQIWQDIRQHYLQVPVVPARHTDAAFGSALLAQDRFNH